ncbi:hypothetical protein ACGF4C_37925 [Streptomyces sp. NPDC048197]
MDPLSRGPPTITTPVDNSASRPPAAADQHERRWSPAVTDDG